MVDVTCEGWIHYSAASGIHMFCCEQHATRVAFVLLPYATGLFNVALLMFVKFRIKM